MKKINGISASKGIAIGRLSFYATMDDAISKEHRAEVHLELNRLENARKMSVEELNAIYQNALLRIDEKSSMIFQIHITMLQDEEFFRSIQEIIREEKVNAEYAVWKSGKQYCEMFAKMDDEYMRGRAADIFDICKRLIRCLQQTKTVGMDCFKGQTIVGAADLMPSETVQMNPEMILAFVTREGSKSSHSAILARTMGIPAVVGLAGAYGELMEGTMTIVDGTDGSVILEPDEQTMEEYRKKKTEFERQRMDLKSLRGAKAVTKRGIKIEINANACSAEDIDMAVINGADGIGLFRSEFLYLNRSEPPEEEQQFHLYRSILRKMKGKRVIIRTIDLGADKQVPYLNVSREENPALGCRGIRLCLKRKDLFIPHLRALLRASAYGKLALMVPMITSVEEIREIKSILKAVSDELANQGVSYDPHLEIGIMIETPASVMISEALAAEADFFSIGTNDLTQYTLAADRGNPAVSDILDPSHPAVLRMIEMAAASAKKADIWVGVCGESAADTSLTEFYIRCGIREFSVIPSAVLELRQAIRQIDL